MEARQNPDQASNFYCCSSCIYTVQRKGGGIQNKGSTWQIIIGAACAGFRFRRGLLFLGAGFYLIKQEEKQDVGHLLMAKTSWLPTSPPFLFLLRRWALTE